MCGEWKEFEMKIGKMDRFFKTTCPDRYEVLKEFAKENRDNPTMAEAVMWKQLKGKKLGVKFLRQHAILDFIVDFVCLEKKLVIEVDGEYHFTEDQKREDEMRCKRLQEMGYHVLRFKNEEVLYKTDCVINIIQKKLQTILI